MTIDYSKGKIYKITSSKTNDVYVGSTCEPTLSRRMHGHRSSFKRYKEGKTNFTSSFEILKYDDAEIILIESYPCKNKDELYSRERYWVDHLKSIYKTRPKITEEERKEKRSEWCENNRERINKTHQKLYLKHKEKITEWKLTRNDCECGGKYINAVKAKHMESRKHKRFLESKSN